MRTLRDVLDSELRRLAEGLRPTGLPSGIGLERRIPGGLLGDKITCLFADPGNFKTTTKNHMLLAMAEAGYRVLDASLEDTPELTAQCYMSRCTDISYGAIAGGTISPAEVPIIRDALDYEIPKNVIVLPDDIEPTADAIIAYARETKVRCVAVDYIQLLEGYGSEKQILDDAVKKFAKFAKQEKVAPLLVSQQKQRDNTRSDPRPRLDDMFGSSAMRIHAKCVIGLFRPWNHWKNPPPNPNPGATVPYGMYSKFLAADMDHAKVYPDLLEAWLLKNRLGRTGAMHLRVHGDTGFVENFDDYMRPYI